MNIRHSTIRDLERMREIYAYARDFMVRTGNPNQWGPTNWPPEELLRQDIAEGNSFVCEVDGRIIGTFFYLYGHDIEPTYREIVDGSWRDDEPFGVVHRLAGDGSAKGIGEFCLNWAFDQSGHLRVDTHGDNKVLQNLLEKLGFERRGTIFVVEDDYPRIAYEK
ncbi:MAG: GNAT family N-acetyltransferase [Firmicutes bacterium]|nr:GNAT family N-acetyltransferase [Bacillota bacterium]